VQENEYQFNQHNVDWFHNIITHSFNELTIFHLLSFFGHYGVPIFVFLSAYGLVIKYETTNNIENQPTVYRFLRFHWLKLFRMMIVGFSAFILVDAITEGQHHYKVIDIVAQMGLFNNVLPNPDDIIWPGPYWFFGLMLQLYIVYRFVGGMLPFGLGLLYAKYMRNTTLYAYVIMFVCSLPLIWYGSNSFFVWLFVPMFVCFAGISFVKLLSYWNLNYPKYTFGIAKMFNWLGVISAALFISHPITRKIIIPISRNGDYWTGLLLYIITSICVAWLFKEIMKRVPSPKL